MKIALVTHTFFPQSVGGRENHVYYLGKTLSRKGHKVEVFTSSDSLLKRYSKFENSNMVIHYFPTIKLPVSMGYYRINPTMLFVLLKKDFDVIHAHEYFHFTTFISALAAKIKKIPFILTEHGYPEQFGASNFLLKLYHRFCLPLIISSSKKVIAVSKSIKNEIISKFSISPEKMSVVYNAIDLNDYTKKSNIFIKKYSLKDKKIILSVGRLIKEKGFQHLIKTLPFILKKISDVRLVIIGPDHYFKKSLVRISEHAGMQNRVFFTGKVSNEMLKSAIFCSDVVVIPSLYEPFGIIALEAMSYGKPIVASRVGGLKEFLVNKETCLFCPPNYSEGLARCLTEILTNKKLSLKLGKNAKEAVKKYDWDKIIDRITCIYSDTI
jgi:glycosyltransferase involved in cell wall biosynthesis